MQPMLEDLARATLASRLADADSVRRGRRHAAAGHFVRTAQDAAHRASLALARAE